ncbi:molybdenum cofactor guanylyltransferase [Lentimicrobium sp. L6]|nr:MULTISPECIES: molybdenum cofactor guanylyltransferase [unclassified Lentimicrobium]NPD85675.1 molybdenum cofactor guanylyltransferase [Lentimicrobium sp. L6]
MKFGSIILSGGKSSRFGTDKGLFVFRKKQMIEYALEMAQIFSTKILISANQKDYLRFGYPVIHDIYPELGPMGGLYSSLMESNLALNLILPCDSPFISEELIQKLIDTYNGEEILLFETADGKIHPLIGFYHKSILESMQEHIKSKKVKLISFIRSRSHNIIKLSHEDALQTCFRNFNSQKDLPNDW